MSKCHIFLLAHFFQEDKRQVTGNLVINGVGQVIFTVVVFAGKTARSLPKVETRERYLQFVYEHSPNHCSNHDIQFRLLKRVYRWTLEDTAADIKISLEEAEKHVKCMHFWIADPLISLRSCVKKFVEIVRACSSCFSQRAQQGQSRFLHEALR